MRLVPVLGDKECKKHISYQMTKKYQKYALHTDLLQSLLR